MADHVWGCLVLAKLTVLRLQHCSWKHVLMRTNHSGEVLHLCGLLAFMVILELSRLFSLQAQTKSRKIALANGPFGLPANETIWKLPRIYWWMGQSLMDGLPMGGRLWKLLLHTVKRNLSNCFNRIVKGASPRGGGFKCLGPIRLWHDLATGKVCKNRQTSVFYCAGGIG